MIELKLIKLSEIRSKPVEWLWAPYIPSGAISLIQGDGAGGKTTVSLAIAAAITKGESLPGSGKSAAPASVIVQNAEDSYTQTIKPRLEQFGADCSMNHVIDEDEQALSLSDERIEQAICEVKAKLLILDPVQAYFGGANMNSAGGVRPLMKRLGDIAARNDCAVLLVGHLHKSGGKAAYRGLGSIDIYAAARSVLTVGRIPVDDDMRAIINNKNNLSPAGSPQAFTINPISGFTWLGEYDVTIDEMFNGIKKPESQFTKARHLIGTEMTSRPVPAADVMQRAEEQGISLKTLNRAKDALGVISIKRGNRWYWELPIDVEFTVVREDGHHGQNIQYRQDTQYGQDTQYRQADYYYDGQSKQTTMLTTLTMFRNGTEG